MARLEHGVGAAVDDNERVEVSGLAERIEHLRPVGRQIFFLDDRREVFAKRFQDQIVAEQLTLGVVENMSYFIPDDQPEKKYYIFGKGASDELAKELNIPVLGRIPMIEKVREGGDTGNPVSLKNDNPVSQAFHDLAKNISKSV